MSSGVASTFPLTGVQRRVRVGESNDPTEHEAEHTADHVNAGPTNAPPKIARLETFHRTCPNPEEQMQHRPSGTASVYCKVTGDSRDKASHSGMDAAAERAISTKGSGSPMREPVRRTLETRMGVDLSEVRVHEGINAHESAAALNARAFTHQNDIWLGHGESQDNTRLMAHEATHVIQQSTAVAVAPTATGGEMAAAQPQSAPPPDAAAPTAHTGGGKSPAGTADAPDKTATPKGAGPAAPNAPAGKPVAEPGDAHAGAAAGEPQAGGKKKKGASPESDPAFVAVVHNVKSVAKGQKVHAPAAAKAAAAHDAVVSPSNEVPSRAAAKQTDVIDQQQPKPFNRAAFKAALLQKIKDTAPKTLEDADNFKKDNKLSGVKSDLNSQVADSKKESQGPIAEKVAEKPDPSGIEPKPTTPLPAPDTGAAPHVPAKGAAPKPATDEDINLQAGPQQVNREMADANVTEQQLQESNEPEFQGALGEKKNLEKESIAAPAAYRAQEPALLHTAQAEAQSAATKQTAGMHATRGHAFGNVVDHQTEAKAAEEKERDRIFGEVSKIYEAAKAAVEARLLRLDNEVNDAFDAGATAAQQAFEDYVDRRMSQYKDDRYDRIGGGLLWAKDKLFGMPDEVDAFYQEGRDVYIAEMDRLIDRVAVMVETGLNEAKAEVTKGKAAIQTFIAGLGPSSQDLGKKAADAIKGKFDSLEQGISDKQDQLVESLARKYNENLKKVNDRIEEMKEENSGLVHKVAGAIKGIIQTIIHLKDMLLNVLSRAASAIGLIIAHPIRFLGNLIDAGKLGFTNFTSNITEHLKQGFMEWLFGKVGETGIQLPKSFDWPGILSLVLQILGLTWANIRARAVKFLGEPIVKTLETAAEIFKIIIAKGLEGLYEYVQEKLGDILMTIIEGIKTFVIERVVMAGITWLIGLLNPASAFVKACKAIYDIIMFFVDHGSEILALVNAIIDSMTAIATGQIAAAAAWIEKTLARAIPVIIGFLASLLGVGGISEKIKSTIESIRNPIFELIDWVINKAVQMAKAVGGFLGIGKEKPMVASAEEAPKSDDPQHDAKVTAGLLAIDEEDKKHEKEGRITREQAEVVAATVQKNHPVFKTLIVVEGKETWDYKYTASLGATKPGAPRQLGVNDIDSQAPVPGTPASTLGGTSMVVHGLTYKHPEGSVPTSSPGVWDKVGGDALTRDKTRLYVRGHLLNRRLGGSGDVENLTPITYSANAQHYQDVESDVLDTVNKKGIVHYEVHVLPASPGAVPKGGNLEETQLSYGLEWKWWDLEVTGGTAKNPILDKKKGGTSKGPKTVRNVPPYPHT